MPGKWVLAGEHAVLSGEPAVALPHPEHALSLRYEPPVSGSMDMIGTELEISTAEHAGTVRALLAALPDLSGRMPAGRLTISSTIPIGAGLGSSAALCVALTNWLSAPLGLARERLAEFATRIEDRFHGQSGMDIAAILAQGPVRFVRGQMPEPIASARLPPFPVHATGFRASTRQCVVQVARQRRDHPAEGRRLDLLSWDRLPRRGIRRLLLYSRGEVSDGLAAITEAMDLSHRCFEGWALVPPGVEAIRRDLLLRGARAAKVTGAGGGGCVVALWGDNV